MSNANGLLYSSVFSFGSSVMTTLFNTHKSYNQTSSNDWILIGGLTNSSLTYCIDWNGNRGECFLVWTVPITEYLANNKDYIVNQVCHSAPNPTHSAYDSMGSQRQQEDCHHYKNHGPIAGHVVHQMNAQLFGVISIISVIHWCSKKTGTSTWPFAASYKPWQKIQQKGQYENALAWHIIAGPLLPNPVPKGEGVAGRVCMILYCKVLFLVSLSVGPSIFVWQYITLMLWMALLTTTTAMLLTMTLLPTTPPSCLNWNGHLSRAIQNSQMTYQYAFPLIHWILPNPQLISNLAPSTPFLSPLATFLSCQTWHIRIWQNINCPNMWLIIDTFLSHTQYHDLAINPNFESESLSSCPVEG